MSVPIMHEAVTAMFCGGHGAVNGSSPRRSEPARHAHMRIDQPAIFACSSSSRVLTSPPVSADCSTSMTPCLMASQLSSAVG